MVLEMSEAVQTLLSVTRPQNVPLRSALSKRRYLNAPVQEKPQEAQTLKQFIAETQFVP